MKNIVISGSASLQDKVNYWLDYFKNKDYEILDYPSPIEQNSFLELYPNVHKNFFKSLTKCDILFIMNEDKNNISGYIGASTFAEISFCVAQNLIYNNNIEILLLKIPDKKVQCYDEITLWLNLGWIKLY